MALSFFFNHGIGIVFLSLLLLFYKPHKEKAPWYLYFGGVFGFFILNANYVTITAIGVSLTMATAVFGQALGSLIFDLTGWMHMKTYPISRRKALSLALCFVGIVLMGAEGGSFLLPYILLGIATGTITMIQMVYNSRLAAIKGIIYSARNNVLSGFIVALIIYGAMGLGPTIRAFSSLKTLPLYLIAGGGILAMVVVMGTNFVIPKIPVIYSALLLSSAQIISSIFLDHLLGITFPPLLLLGAIVILVGMVINVWVDSIERKSS